MSDRWETKGLREKEHRGHPLEWKTNKESPNEIDFLKRNIFHLAEQRQHIAPEGVLHWGVIRFFFYSFIAEC